MSLSPSTRLSATEATIIDPVRAAVDDHGKVTIAWIEHTSRQWMVYARRFDPNNGWDPNAKALQKLPVAAANVSVAAGPDGSAVVAWNRAAANHWDTVAVRFESDAWSEVQLLESDDSGSASAPTAAIDMRGDAYVVWPQFDGTHTRTRAVRFLIGQGWTNVDTLNPDANFDTSDVRLLAHPGVGAWAVWREVGSSIPLRTSEFYAEQGWSVPQPINVSPAFVTPPKLAYDTDAVGLVVGTDGAQPLVSAYTASHATASSFVAPVSASQQPVTPHVASSLEGDVLVAWRRVDARAQTIEAAHVSGSLGWSEATEITTGSTQLGDPTVAYGRRKAAVIWLASLNGHVVPQVRMFDADLGWSTVDTINLTASDANADAAPVATVDCAGGSTAAWITHSPGAVGDTLMVSQRH